MPLDRMLWARGLSSDYLVAAAVVAGVDRAAVSASSELAVGSSKAVPRLHAVAPRWLVVCLEEEVEARTRRGLVLFAW